MTIQTVTEALDRLKMELERLEPAVKNVEIAQRVTEMVASIPHQHIKLLEDLQQQDLGHKKELSDLFVKELELITEENQKLYKRTTELQETVTTELEEMVRLRDSMQRFHDKVEKINFPERLDKMDANIAGIMAAVQSVQSRIDMVERNFTDRLKDVSEQQKDMRTALQEVIGSLSKKQQMNAYVNWGIMILIIVIIVVLRFMA